MANYKDYENFIGKSKKQIILFLEIGVGFNTPSIIRWPFENYTQRIKNKFLIRLNLDDASIDKKIEYKSLSFQCDTNSLIEDLIKEIL